MTNDVVPCLFPVDFISAISWLIPNATSSVGMKEMRHCEHVFLSCLQDSSMDVKGAIAEWSGKGLQSLQRRFDSASRLQILFIE
jgi:hypothetical protein